MLGTDDWKLLGRCRADGVDPDTWFPTRGDAWTPSYAKRTLPAKAECIQCPVRDRCLAEALTQRIEFGVWGGLDEFERRELLTRRRPRKTAAAGEADDEPASPARAVEVIA